MTTMPASSVASLVSSKPSLADPQSGASLCQAYGTSTSAGDTTCLSMLPGTQGLGQKMPGTLGMPLCWSAWAHFAIASSVGEIGLR